MTLKEAEQDYTNFRAEVDASSGVDRSQLSKNYSRYSHDTYVLNLLTGEDELYHPRNFASPEARLKFWTSLLKDWRHQRAESPTLIRYLITKIREAQRAD